MQNNLMLSTQKKNRRETMESRDARDSLVSAASALFVIAARANKLSQDTDPMQLHTHLISVIHQLEARLQNQNIRVEHILLVKYFMCALLDDLMAYDWLKDESLWSAYSLRFYFFQEQTSAPRIFELIARLQQEPSSNIHLLELAYMVLVYGYQGGYRHEPNGYYQLLEKIDELYHILHWHHGDFRKNLLIQQRS